MILAPGVSLTQKELGIKKLKLISIGHKAVWHAINQLSPATGSVEETSWRGGGSGRVVKGIAKVSRFVS